MPFRLSRKRSLDADVPRIVRKQAEKAAAGLSQQDNIDEGIHVARTCTKRLRGLLRLLKPGLGSRHAVEDEKLEKLQKVLGPLRDAQVMLETFDELFGSTRGKKRKPSRAHASVRAALAARAAAERDQGGANDRLSTVQNELRKLARRSKAWAPRHAKRADGFGALEKGFESTYRRARKARDVAYRTRTPEAFHDWRRAVKYHGHQLKLLSAIEPAAMAARLEDNDELGDLLGRDHDLAVLAVALETLRAQFANERESRTALAAVARRQQSLRKRAEPLGKRLFAQTPAAFRRSVRNRFREWRRGRSTQTEALEPRQDDLGHGLVVGRAE